MTRDSLAAAMIGLAVAGCGRGPADPGSESILVDPDHRHEYVLMDVGPGGAGRVPVRVPVGTRVRVVERRPYDPRSTGGGVVVNVLEGEHAGEAGSVFASQLAPR